MATQREATFGTTACVIYTNFHVQMGADKHPAVATAFADGKEVTQNGMPVGFFASTEDQAVEMMIAYLEKTFGQRTSS